MQDIHEMDSDLAHIWLTSVNVLLMTGLIEKERENRNINVSKSITLSKEIKGLFIRTNVGIILGIVLRVRVSSKQVAFPSKVLQ
jgi:hypothetical protein